MRAKHPLSWAYMSLFIFAHLMSYSFLFILFWILFELMEENPFSMVIMVMAPIFLSYFFAFHILNLLNRKLYIIAPTMTETPPNLEDFHEIDKDSDEIERKFSNLEKMTLEEIKMQAREIVSISRKINQKIQAQKAHVVQLTKVINVSRTRFEEERAKVVEAEKIARELKKTTEAQLGAIASVLTKDARIENKRYFWRGLLVTIPVGVLFSFVPSDWVESIFSIFGFNSF